MKTYYRRKVHSTRPSVMGPSLVELARKSGPCGDAKWAGWSLVYQRISRASEKMGQSNYLSDVHIDTMADLGSGHEERMKARFHWLMSNGWLDNDDLTETREIDDVLRAGKTPNWVFTDKGWRLGTPSSR